MAVELTPLAEAFVADHRKITRRLNRLLQAVRNGDLPAARQVARELDRLAGPHIQFEEEVLYPYIARVLGDDYAAQLYDEHDAGRTALTTLARPDAPPAFDPPQQAELQGLLEAAVEHAATCATLLSHLSEASPATQSAMHARLTACRENGQRWTELPTATRRAVPAGKAAARC